MSHLCKKCGHRRHNTFRIVLVRRDPTPPPVAAGFKPGTSTSRVQRFTGWAIWYPGESFLIEIVLRYRIFVGTRRLNYYLLAFMVWLNIATKLGRIIERWSKFYKSYVECSLHLLSVHSSCYLFQWIAEK